MAINLQDIRTAALAYLGTKVTVTISTPTPAGGLEINPNEKFSFTLTAKNADAATGGIQLKDVVWGVWIEDGAVGKLIVPSSPVARETLTAKLKLEPGTPVESMFLFPESTLKVGESNTIPLQGQAGNAPLGSTNIKFRIFGDVDMNWLFAADQPSATATQPLEVRE